MTAQLLLYGAHGVKELHQEPGSCDGNMSLNKTLKALAALQQGADLVCSKWPVAGRDEEPRQAMELE